MASFLSRSGKSRVQQGNQDSTDKQPLHRISSGFPSRAETRFEITSQRPFYNQTERPGCVSTPVDRKICLPDSPKKAAEFLLRSVTSKLPRIYYWPFYCCWEV